jgi:hypothetical protein
MQTSVRDWYIIKVLEDQNLRVGQLLWGVIVDDPSGRFSPGDYVSTSAIDKISKNIIITAKGSHYVTQGAGREFTVSLSEVELLRRGYSPTQITRLR